ncbi:MAG: ArdC family protein [Clostridia bacterium]|nr:ArdC family protein [Clostridia bacterium]
MKTENKKPNTSTKEIVKTLEEGLDNLFQSGKYEEWLTTMSKFHHYSLNNTLLIASQKPEATYVAGYDAWKANFGRQVRKNEKGIKIIAPVKRKKEIFKDKIDPKTGEQEFDKNGEPVKERQELIVPAFKITTVFDISQTEGPELPSLGVYELTGDVEQYELFRQALEKSCTVSIKYRNIIDGSKGSYNLVDKSITIQEDMPEIQTIKTLVHEMAHQRLHDRDTGEAANKPRDTKELEAESVAYTVCKHFNIDTSQYSFGYIAGWSQDKEMNDLKESLNLIVKTSDAIIKDVEKNFAEIMLESMRPVHVDKTFELADNKTLTIHSDSKDVYFYQIKNSEGRLIEGDQFLGTLDDLIRLKAGAVHREIVQEDKTVEVSNENTDIPLEEKSESNRRPSLLENLKAKKEQIANKDKQKENAVQKTAENIHGL